ncbi:MAG: amino acid decarboxylase, partial [Proteobacteria bacterium]|nr:amino acid decarboxylase [Pseudomonadota bacterium]
MTKAFKNETSLDPSDWDDFRKQGHKIFDDLVDDLASLREGKAWRPMDEDAIKPFQSPVPRDGVGLEGAYRDYVGHVRPHPMGLNHPRFWGWAGGAGTPDGMIANMISTAFHSPNIIFQHSSFYAELQVIEWFKEIFGFQKDASGILVSGGSMANFVGLAVARHARAGADIRKKGLGSKTYTVYGSGETHYSVPKALDVLGLGSDSFRIVPVDNQFRIDVDALKKQIVSDRKEGMVPIAISANAGTIKTGATDPLDELADLAEAEGLWLHCDGAFGAMAIMSGEYKHLVKGLGRVNSLAFDLHKWLSQPYEVGGVLIQPGKLLEESFSYSASYVTKLPGSITDVPFSFSHRGVELSRGFRAFPFWFTMKSYGLEKFGEMITKNIEQAQYLKSLLDASKTLECMAPVPMNVVNFRYKGEGDLSEEKLDKL